jgi:DNA-damage-inducible protein J
MYRNQNSQGSGMAATSMIHVRVDDDIKTQATETLASMGLTVSDAVRVFLIRVVAEKQLPFSVKVPNAATREAMVEAEEIVKSRHARFATAAALFHELEKDGGR